MSRRLDRIAARVFAVAIAASLGSGTSALGAEPPSATSAPDAQPPSAPEKVAARGSAAAPASGSSSTSTGFLADLPGASSDEPIVVHSKELEFDYQSNRVFYRGDVRATQGDITIDCDELIVFFDRADDVRRAELRAVVAQGNVVITLG